MKKYFLFFCFLFLWACGPSPTKIWLNEYEILLRDTALAVSGNANGSDIEQLRLKLSEKEAQINELLKNASMQDQMSFLSEYYDMRVKFFYQVQY